MLPIEFARLAGFYLAEGSAQLVNGCEALSFSFHIDADPTGTPKDHCRDRDADADEAGLDCGGSCQPCWDYSHCNVDSDCQSRACIPGGPDFSLWCAAATCSDGVRDAFESDVDCGGPCAPCAKGLVCANKTDCASMSCDNSAPSRHA